MSASLESAGSFGISGSGPTISRTRFSTVSQLVSTMSRIRRTRSFRAPTSTRSSRIGSTRGRPVSPPSAAASVDGFGRVDGLSAELGVGLEVEEPPVDLYVGGPLPDRLDRRPERLVVEHASVDEPGRGRLELRQLVEPEEPLLEPSEIDGTVLSEPALQRFEADGREDAGDRGGRPRGEGERAVGVVVEVVAAVVAAEAEGQQVPMAPVVDRIRVGIGHLAPVAVEVGHRHEQLELVPVGQQRRQRGGRRAVLVHPVEGVVDPAGHQVAAERRFLQRVQRDPDAFEHARRQPSRRCEQAVDVAALEPEVAELVLRQVVRQRLRETDAVDPAGRGAGDHVDDDARPEVLAVSLAPILRAAARRRARSAWPPRRCPTRAGPSP